MAEIWENKEFQAKMSRLPPDLRDRFVRFVKTMYDRESDLMLKFISESRDEMVTTAHNIHEEQEELRQEASRIGQASRMSMDDPHASMYSPTDSIFAEAVDSYLNDHDDDAVVPFVPDPPPRRPVTAGGTEDRAKMQEESLEVVKNMSGYDVKIENERERQTERVEKLKNKVKERKAARENLAMELLDLAQGIEEGRKKDKEEQQARLKERLEEMKKKRQDGDPEGDAPLEDDEEKKKKKKKEKKEKKKKKDKDGDETVIDMDDENGEHEKKKKKKKKKDKDDEEAAD